MKSAQSNGARAGTVVFLTVVCLLARVVVGQNDQNPLEPADTSSPRATLKSFTDSINAIHAVILSEPQGRERVHERSRNNLKQILSCMDLREMPEYLRRDLGLEAAVCLKEVFDRIELPPLADVPDAEAIEENPEAWARWRVPGTPITIVRIAEGDRAGEYLFSADTVDNAAEFYELVEHMPYRTEGPEVTEGLYQWFLTVPGSDRLAAIVRVLPAWTKNRVADRAIWQWVALAVTFLGVAMVVWLTYRLSRWRALTGPEAGRVRRTATLLFPLALILAPLWARDFITEHLSIYGTTLVVARFVLNMTFLVGLVVFVMALFHWLAQAIIASPRIHPMGVDAQFIRLVCRLTSVVAVVVVFLEGGQYLGISLTTLVAGAGMGGLALALSAQEFLKGVFGSMMIMLDRPYRVGERIVAQGYDGVVQEIGLRSTKIRLLTDHVVAIPNETMARCDIENIGRRGRIRRLTDIRLPLDTPAEKADRAVEIIRNILQDHEGMDPEFPPRVYLREFNPDSLNVRIWYWYHPPDYWSYMAFSEKLNLRIKRELEAAGIAFALPATTTFLRRPTTGPSTSASSDVQEPPR
jgi:MscS family membrane protein